MSRTDQAPPRRWPAAGWCVWGSLIAMPVAAQQPMLSHARMQVEVREEAPDRLIARVELEYELRVDPEVTELPLRALRFAGALPEDIRASVDGTDVTIRVRSAGASRLEGRVALPVRGGPDLRLRLSYRVVERLRDEAYRLTLPLLLPGAVPTGAPDDFFVATLRLPDGHVILEAFPTLPPPQPDAEGVGRSFRLQVVPAMIRWRGSVGEAPLLRFGRIIDLSALLVLAVTGVLALRVLGRDSSR